MIARVLRLPVTLMQVVGRVWATRDRYSSWSDLGKVMLLLGSAPGASALRRVLGMKPYVIHPRCAEAPLHIRASSSDYHVFTDIFYDGEYAPISGWAMPPRPVVFDLGANIGMSSVYFGQVWKDSALVSLEPDDANLELLKANCRHLIDAGRLAVMRGFAAASDGFAEIVRDEDPWGFKKGATSGQKETGIRCWSIPTLMRETNHTRIDVLKCDIEGSERELFADCAPWIGSVHHLIVEVHDPYTLEHLYADLRRNGWPFEIAATIHGKVCFLRRTTNDSQLPPA